MYRRRSHNSLSSRCASALSRWWIDIRFFWHATNKTAWVVLSIAGLAIAGFAFLLQSMFTEHTDRQSLHCLALNVYHEARGEPRSGQYAVAEVTMNRVASRHFPGTVCSVVYEKRWDYLRKRHVGAFSWTELDALAAPEGKEWPRAWQVAETVYRGRHEPKLQGVMHYHAVYIKPSWARGRRPVARIGKHLFYRS